MRFRNQRTNPKPSRLEMSSMIDVVFLLLVFFVMTFQIVAAEGDLDLNTLKHAEGIQNPNLPLIVRLQADPDGQLESIKLNDQPVNSLDDLNQQIRQLCSRTAPASRKSLSATIYCEANLPYETLVDAVTAVSGYVDQDKYRVKLIENVRFVTR